jgi:tRNA threonylcarbamoyladenosine biosynthesis protein TsaE
MADTVGLDGLRELADRLWHELPVGGVVWLSGDLGTGKTTFVQALARSAGAEPARSPTFALVHEYGSPAGVLAHVDCYRLRDPDEALDLDFPGLQRSARLLLIEWPDRAGSLAPSPDVHLQFGHVDDPGERSVERVT